MSSFIENNGIDLSKDAAICRVSSGSTCEAFAVNVGGRQQFLKKLKDEYSGSPKHIALFTKEYTIGKSLSHPNLVRYNDLQTTASGIFILQDFVSGDTLRQRIDNNPEYFLDAAKLRRFIVQLLDCLSYLHSQQIIHLDLNEDNMMFTQVDDSLRVLDLGFCYTDIYRELAGRNDYFAAPEQKTGNIDKLSARTDLYAVGKILELISQKAYEPHGKTLPKQLAKLASLCMQENPDDRPYSAKDCLKLLRKSTRNRLTIAGLCTLIALCAFIAFNPSARKVVRYTLTNLHLSSYDIADRSGNLYRILSEKDATCEAVGYRRPYEIDNPELVIHPRVTHFGKEYEVISIAEKAYLNDTTMTSVFIPEGIRAIGQQAFRGCRNIRSLSLPSSIEVIGEDCFAHDSLLQHILLPKGLKILENNCFVDCHALHSIVIPEGVEIIEMDCFVSCHSLETVELPSSLKSIQRGVFFNCDALKTITIPASITSIGDYAFYHCSKLTDVYILSSTPFPIASVFNTEGLTIHVPAESLEAYRETPGWETMNLTPLQRPS